MQTPSCPLLLCLHVCAAIHAGATSARDGSSPGKGLMRRHGKLEITETSGSQQGRSDLDVQRLVGADVKLHVSGLRPETGQEGSLESSAEGGNVAVLEKATPNTNKSLGWMSSLVAVADAMEAHNTSAVESLSGLLRREDEANHSMSIKAFWLLTCMVGLLLVSCLMVCMSKLSEWSLPACVCAREPSLAEPSGKEAMVNGTTEENVLDREVVGGGHYPSYVPPERPELAASNESDDNDRPTQRRGGFLNGIAQFVANDGVTTALQAGVAARASDRPQNEDTDEEDEQWRPANQRG